MNDDSDNDNYDDLPELTPAEIDRLRNLGLSQSAIARRYGVTRQYISWIKYYHGCRLTPREEVMLHWPFNVPAEMSQTSPYKRLRDHGEFMATGGVGMSDNKLSRLRQLYRKLRDENLVLEFDPEIPPIEGVSNKGGWAFRARRASDEDLIIRKNDYADITDRGRMIWRFPPTEP